MAEIIRITSEALQATVRRLLPSQQGFGDDLQATNLITPIIDLTPTAEGSQLPDYLANAANFTDSTAILVTNTTTTIANTSGFWAYNVTVSSNNGTFGLIQVNNGFGTRIINGSGSNSATIGGIATAFSGVVFLDTGESLEASSNSAESLIFGSIRQVADRYGNIQNPTGFTFE